MRTVVTRHMSRGELDRAVLMQHVVRAGLAGQISWIEFAADKF
jgi:hypothetical protein